MNKSLELISLVEEDNVKSLQFLINSVVGKIQGLAKRNRISVEGLEKIRTEINKELAKMGNGKSKPAKKLTKEDIVKLFKKVNEGRKEFHDDYLLLMKDLIQILVERQAKYPWLDVAKVIKPFLTLKIGE